jgi:hypothetical protein
MILQICYDEAIATTIVETDLLISRLERGPSRDCGELAMKYKDKASQTGSGISEEIGDQKGWLRADLDLLFAKQRLETVRLIQRECQ